LFIVVHSARIGENAKGEPLARPAERIPCARLASAKVSPDRLSLRSDRTVRRSAQS
jgi:hypothetical protein